MAVIPYKTLRIKIVIVTLFFAVVPLFALGITLYWQFESAYSDKIKQTATLLAENERRSIEMFFDERISQVTTVARTHNLDAIKNEDYLSRVFDVMQSRSKAYLDLGVIDQNGNHVAYVGPYYDQLKAVNYANTEWFQAVMVSGIYVSDVFLGFRKIPHFIIAVTRVEGNKTWILRATINSDIIEHMIRKAQSGRKGDAFLVNAQNILQTTPRYSGKLLEKPNTPDFSRSRGLHNEEIGDNSETVMYVVTQLQTPAWVLVLKEYPTEEMGPLFKTKYAGSFILAGGLFLIVLGTIWTSRSMTEQLFRMEREKAASDDLVIQSSKMAALGKMAAGIAHEINNPLAIIGEKAGWMKDLLEKEDLRTSENFNEFEDCIVKIERQVERSRAITHRLLRFGRRMEPTMDLVDLNAILAETITFLENEAMYREITIGTNYGELPRITTDSTQLQQVFLNIINNAIDAVGKMGHIRINTRSLPDSGEIRIDIEDSGPGMPKEVLAKIFDPFFTTKGPSEGTGLGLSISYSIVEKLGGRILVDSVIGKGTVFSIFIPAKQA